MIDRAGARQGLVMKMNFFLPIAVVGLLTSVSGCSGGSDVYVGEKPSDQRSASSSTCVIAIGEDVCANLSKFAAPAPAPETVDAILAVMDFGAGAFDAASAMMRSCGSILDELQIRRPQPAASTEPPPAPSPLDIGRMATSYCDAASAAIRDRLQGATPAIGITLQASPCTPIPLATDSSHACGTSAAVPRRSCAAPTVTVEIGAAPSAERRALKATLEKHLPGIYGAKSKLDLLAALSTKLTGGTDDLASLQPACTQSLTQMVSTSVTLTSNAVEAAGKIVAAMP